MDCKIIVPKNYKIGKKFNIDFNFYYYIDLNNLPLEFKKNLMT